MTRATFTLRVPIPFAAFVAGALLSAVVGRAALGGGSGVVIPYSGHLDRNGAPLDAVVDLEFKVFNGPADLVACDTVRADDVLVAGGELATSVQGIDEACVRGRDVFLELAVDADGNGMVALTGRQRVLPSLAALTSGTGDFDVAAALTTGTLTASNVTTANGTVTSRLTLSIGGCLRVPDAAATFLVCAGSGVRVYPEVDPPAGTPVFRVTDSASNSLLRVDHNTRVLVREPLGIEVQGLTGTQRAFLRPSTMEVRNATDGDSITVSPFGIDATDNAGDDTPVELETGVIINGEGSGDLPENDTLTLIEDNAADKLYIEDTTCALNALWVGVCNTNSTGQACICTCQHTAERTNRGWYCFN